MDYLTKLCDELEISPEIKEPNKGEFLFPLLSDLVIKVKQLHPGIYFHSPICPCPEVKKEDLFILLMKANLFGQGTLGAAIGYKEEGNLLTLSSTFPYDMDYRTFKESIEDFANMVDYWKEEVHRHVELSENGML